jgi:translation elongation factor EF-Tu-like GTPase
MPAPRVEAEIRYLTTEEGGRRGPVASGYRGQFHYEGEDHDGIQSFPDFPAGEFIPLGQPVRALIWLPDERWKDYHSRRIHVGTRFQIREGRKIVGRGVITRVDPET